MRLPPPDAKSTISRGKVKFRPHYLEDTFGVFICCRMTCRSSSRGGSFGASFEQRPGNPIIRPGRHT